MHDAALVRGGERVGRGCAPLLHALAGSGPRSSRSRSVSPSSSSVTMKVTPLGVADVVEREQARVIERGHRARLALEALRGGTGSPATSAGSVLSATSRSSRVSRAL